MKDPIDVATGHMVLPQTDISLPGSLPLLFHRSFESSYCGGRWFGPAWASTVDQRLEIDSQGVIFVGDDGSLLAYPHPAPGVPVMPTHGRRWPLDRDPDGNYAVTDPASGRVRRFAPHIGNLALLTQLDDRNGNWITFEYDATGAPSDIVHSGGYHLKLTTHEGRITALYLAGAAADGTDQQIRRYGYTGGHLTEVTNSSGRPLSFGHDVHGRIDSWTDTNGSRFDYVYDEHGRCTAQSGASGHLSATLAYDDTDPDSGLRVTAVTDSLGHTTRYLINERAQVVAEIDPLGAVTRSEYDRHNRLLSRTDPLGRTLLLRYNDAGNLTSVVRPDGRETTAEYNGLGLPVRMTNPDRTSIGQEYDARGNCVTRTDPSGATTRYIYDEAGHLTTVTDALGSTTLIRSNKAGLPVEVTDPLGSITHIERDAFGRPVTITDPLGSTTCHEWTAEGKPACRIEADGTRQSWTYDGEGNCLTHTDAMGALTQFEYTHFDLMTARTGPDGVRYEFQHDHELRLRRVLNPQGLTWDYEYDEAGRLVAETDFDGRTLSYARDTAGRLTSRTDALGRIIRFERDALDRIVAKDVNGSVTTFEYDLSDQLGQAVGPEARVTFLRDRYGLLKSETVNGQTMTFQYDRLGRRTGRTTPSGAISKWTYDLAGRRSSLTSSGRVLTFEHDAAGREIARHMGDAVTFASGFDALGRLTSQHVTGTDRSIQRRQYAYRADGILTCIHDLLSGSKSFDLDMAGRVTGVHAADWTEHYSYDETGNQTEASWPSSHPGQEARGTRSYNGTAITRAGTVRYEHDALGRITMRQKIRLSRKPETWRYEWDAEDRLAKVATPDGETWSYAYDPLGRRIAKKRLADDGLTVAEQVTFTWDGTILCEQIHDDCDSSHSVALTWDHDGLCPLTQTERIFAANTPQEKIAERFFSIATDLGGAPKELIDESGELAWYTRSTLWGATTWAVKSGAYTPLRFPGQYYDPETGLHYNFFRYYEPETARYLTPDPLGLTPAPNPNTYVNNPNNWVDPLGLGPCRELGLSTGAQRALEKLENIKRDPLGEINSQPNHNHYDAARREANGEVVARKPDGTPFDHIADLKQARNGLDKVRKVIELELKQLPESLTERGLEVLMNKQVEVNRLLNNLNGFLHSIGHR